MDGQDINQGLQKDTDPGSVTVEDAVELLKGPIVLGRHPGTGLDVTVQTGRFGLYYKHGSLQFSVGTLPTGEEPNWDHAIARLDKKAMRLGAISPDTSMQELVLCFPMLLNGASDSVKHVCGCEADTALVLQAYPIRRQLCKILNTRPKNQRRK